MNPLLSEDDDSTHHQFQSQTLQQHHFGEDSELMASIHQRIEEAEGLLGNRSYEEAYAAFTRIQETC